MQRKNLLKSISTRKLLNKSAYETLGDESKKKTYDSTGMTGDEQGFPGGQDPFSTFRNFWS